MTVKETLTRVLALIEDQSHWTGDGHYAVNAAGAPCSTIAPGATRFCAAGAIYHVQDSFDQAAAKALEAVVFGLYGASIVAVNDGPDGHARIVRALREAIKEAA